MIDLLLTSKMRQIISNKFPESPIAEFLNFLVLGKGYIGFRISHHESIRDLMDCGDEMTSESLIGYKTAGRPLTYPFSDGPMSIVF